MFCVITWLQVYLVIFIHNEHPLQDSTEVLQQEQRKLCNVSFYSSRFLITPQKWKIQNAVMMQTVIAANIMKLPIACQPELMTALWCVLEPHREEMFKTNPPHIKCTEITYNCWCDICFAALKKAKATPVLNAIAMKGLCRSVAVAPCRLWNVLLLCLQLPTHYWWKLLRALSDITVGGQYPIRLRFSNM